MRGPTPAPLKGTDPVDIGARTVVATAVVLVAIALALYQPGALRPFYVQDFAEFIPLLERSEGVIDGTKQLAGYYSAQGRFNVIPYALLAVKWELFGWWSPGWQLARAAMMIVLFLLMYRLMRRLSASRLGSMIGGTVFLWAPAASDGWVHLSMGEPLALAIALAMAIRATNYQATTHWRREATLLGIAAAALVLTKELIAPVLALPLVMGLAFHEGTFAMPSATRRNAILLGSVCAGIAVASIPVVAAFLSADNTAYASLYGRRMQSLEGLLAIWITGLFPFDAIVARTNALWRMAIVGFTVLIFAGWRLGFRKPDRRPARWLLFTCLAISFIGVLAYLPSPWFARFYLIPYLISSSFLVGFGASYLQEQGRSGFAFAVSSWIAISLYALTSAFGFARSSEAVQFRDDRLVGFVADSSDADSIVFASSRPLQGDWIAEESPTAAPRGLGSTLYRYAAATKRDWPPTLDTNCGNARTILTASPRVDVLNYERTCDLGDLPSRRIVQRFTRFDQARLRFVPDSTQAQVFNNRTPRRP